MKQSQTGEDIDEIVDEDFSSKIEQNESQILSKSNEGLTVSNGNQKEYLNDFNRNSIEIGSAQHIFPVFKKPESILTKFNNKIEFQFNWAQLKTRNQCISIILTNLRKALRLRMSTQMEPFLPIPQPSCKIWHGVKTARAKKTKIILEHNFTLYKTQNIGKPEYLTTTIFEENEEKGATSEEDEKLDQFERDNSENVESEFEFKFEDKKAKEVRYFKDLLK